MLNGQLRYNIARSKKEPGITWYNQQQLVTIQTSDADERRFSDYGNTLSSSNWFSLLIRSLQ
jgi:hypothetical protein